MIILLIAAAALAAGVLYAWCVTFRSPDKVQNDIFNIPDGEQYQHQRDVMYQMIRDMDAIPFQRVTIRSRDGLTLSARYYHHAHGAPIAICFHGYRGTSIRDFCGGARLCLSHGHNVLLVDQRAHGESEGHAITFGIRERFDCLDWVRWAEEQGSPAILLYGISMGAATVLMAAGEGLPSTVRAAIADSPYSSPEAIIAKVSRDMHLPPALSMPFIRTAARLAGFSLAECTVADAVRRARIPILIIHGEDDRFVPCEMSAEIAAANPSIRRHTFPEAGHGISYMKDTPRYHALVHEFLSGIPGILPEKNR